MKQYKYKPGDYLGKNNNVLMLDRIDGLRGIFKCPICGDPFEARINDVNRLDNKVCGNCGTSNFKHFPGEYLGVNKDILFVDRLGKDEHGDYIGKFLCPICGEIFEARISAVASGNSYQSCGCNARKLLHDKNFNKPIYDLTGQRFGNLTVIGVWNDRTDGGLKYECKCDCGNTTYVEPYSLKDGSTTSCGCIKSKGEKRIIELLNSLKIEYQTQKRFDTCKDEKQLSFDFYLPNYNLLIEYNGIQHYRTGSGWNNNDKIAKTRLHDEIKRKWCIDNNMSLLVISYKEFESLNEEYIIERINETISNSGCCGGCV